ncbi:MAG: hypothetical protein H6606_09470 [Flavobacteriales bacterium]|nr:hypothetical protein [Flavobacteriales bacterium]
MKRNKHQIALHINLAILNRELSLEFHHRHTAILNKHQITVSSANSSWLEDDNVTIVSAHASEKNMTAGVRIHKKNPLTFLPLEVAMYSIYPEIITVISKLNNTHSIYEICGLWSEANIHNKTINIALSMLAATSIFSSHNHAIFLFNSPFTFYISRALGFKRYQEFNSAEGYPYPTSQFRSYIWTRYEDIKKGNCRVNFYSKLIKKNTPFFLFEQIRFQIISSSCS